MPESVIKRIAAIAEREKQGEDLIFTDRNCNAILNHNVEGDDISTAGVDIETGNETGGDDSSDNQNENQNQNQSEIENESEIESNNQPFITDDDDQLGIVMESGEDTPQSHAEIPGVLDCEAAGVLGNDNNGETTGVPGDGDETATEPNAEPAGVLGDESQNKELGADEDPTDEIAGVLEENEEDTGVSHNEIEEAPTTDNQPSDNDDSDEENEFHEEISDKDVYHPDTMTPSVQRTYDLRPRKPRDYSHRHAMAIHHQ
jgi:hypothetical protein